MSLIYSASPENPAYKSCTDLNLTIFLNPDLYKLQTID
jgi:hypothetical protein